jgi:hypothetical protein
VRIPFIFDDFHFCRSRVIGLDMMENRIFTLCRMITWVVFLRILKFYQLFTGEERRIPFIFDDFHFCRSRVIGLDMMDQYTSLQLRCRGYKNPLKNIRKFWTKKDFESQAFLWVSRVRPNKHKILSAVYWGREEDPCHFWWFSLLPFKSYWTWYDGK